MTSQPAAPPTAPEMVAVQFPFLLAEGRAGEHGRMIKPGGVTFASADPVPLIVLRRDDPAHPFGGTELVGMLTELTRHAGPNRKVWWSGQGTIDTAALAELRQRWPAGGYVSPALVARATELSAVLDKAQGFDLAGAWAYVALRPPPMVPGTGPVWPEATFRWEDITSG